MSLSGNLGELTSAAALNLLPRLQGLTICDLFGMEASDCLLPHRVPQVEDVSLYGIPANYAAAMRKTWRPHVSAGVELDVRGARKPEWVAANAANPLRDWDGREHIPRAGYRKAVAQYKATRGAYSRTPFIETVEREELFDALDFLAQEAQTAAGRDLSAARAALIEGVNSIRDW
ncbi:hypothetical protein ABZ446_45515 [Streptomyces sp. NPDC005813]|uniref:hypothetical protein n=1 Tax=Streptomyces sp. NPDC005813 TaxID=3155592 RepID=UPI0033F6D5C1